MTLYNVASFNPSTGKLGVPQGADGYNFGKPAHFVGAITVDSTVDGRDIAADGARLDLLTYAGALDLDALDTLVSNHQSQLANITVSAPVNLDTFATQLSYISVSQSVDLDTIEARVNALDAAVVLMGTWDASTALFPTSTNSGESWIVSVADTVDGVDFAVGDRIVALVDSAPNSVYSGNWLKLDYTDKVTSVAGRTGAVVLLEADITDLQGYTLPADFDSLAKLNALCSESLLVESSIDTLAKLNSIVTETLIDDTDSRLTDARTPVSHTHVNDDITDSHILIPCFYATRKLVSGSVFIHGFYNAPAADMNLTQASATGTFGSANGMHAAHAFMVFGAGSTDGTNITLTVSGTSWTDAGVRTPGDSEVLYTGPVAGLTLNDYLETDKKFIGTVTYTLTSDGVNFTLDFNYGLCKYYDYANHDFVIDWVEFTGQAEENDSGFDIQILKHGTTGYTYSAAAFDPVVNVIASSATDLVTEKNLVAGEEFAWKHLGLAESINGTGSEGFLIQVTTATSDSITFMNGAVSIIVSP